MVWAACGCFGTTKRGALLLERLGRSLHELALPIGRRHEILCSMASRVWCRAPDCGLPTGAMKGRWLVEFITATWEDLGRPSSQRTVDHALVCASRRIDAHDDDRAVLVHGDVHQWNTLEGGNGFKLVDPDGLLAEAEYDDMGIVMREDPVELLRGDPHKRARWLGARTGSMRPPSGSGASSNGSGLAYCAPGLQPAGWQMLAVADRFAAEALGSP